MKFLQYAFLPAVAVLTFGCPQADDTAKKAAEAPAKKIAEVKAAASKPATAQAIPANKPMAEPPPAAGDIPAPEDVAAPPADAEKTKTGLASKVLTAGKGDKPSETDTVEVHYTGWTTDGKMFDSSVKRGQPTSFPLNRVIPGWTEGVQLMSVGEKRRFWIPEELAYKGRPGAPQGMLVFDVELLSIKSAPKAPKDVAKAPKDAKKTKSGLSYKSLSKGASTDKPIAANTVKVHYTGWTTDGEMFDSSVVRGKPATFPLSGVIAGWTEGLQLMTVGEKMRFWIPEDLAYKGQRPPKGMLVFDVELIEIMK